MNMAGSNKKAVSFGFGIPADDVRNGSDASVPMLSNGSAIHDKERDVSMVASRSSGIPSMTDMDRSFDDGDLTARIFAFEHEGYDTFGYFDDVEDATPSAGLRSATFVNAGRSYTVTSDTEDDDRHVRRFSFTEEWSDNKESTAISSVDNTGPAMGYAYLRDVRGSVTDEEFYSDSTFRTRLVPKKVIGTASTPLVAWNLLNSLLGTSILALPFAVASGGYLVLVFIAIVALVSVYTSRLLIDMMYEKSTRNPRRTIRMRLDYAELGQDALNSSNGALLVRAIQVLEMFAICVLNICVLAQLCHEILPKIGIKACTAIVAVMALPTFFIRALSVIGWLQTLGVLSLGIGLALVEGYSLGNVSAWKLSRVPTCDWERLPISVGIVIYAFGVQAVMPGMEQQMSNPKRFGRVVGLTFTVAVVVQSFFSFSNAVLYGKATSQVITIDLESHFGLGVASACFIGMSILCNFSLPVFVVMATMDKTVHQLMPWCPAHGDSRRHSCLTITLRVLVMTLSAGLAVLLPYFAFLMGLIGSGITVLTSLVMPCWFHLRLRGKAMGVWRMALDISIILFGVTCMGLGSFFSFKAIYRDILQHVTDI